MRWNPASGRVLARGAGTRFSEPAVRRAVRAIFAVWLGIVPIAALAADRIEIEWPTPHPGWAKGRPAGEFLQHAGSGDPASGGFGGVRSGGKQFHEGIDIRPVRRDRRGEALDDVFAAMDGVVRHVNPVAGGSSYGRYVVLEHPSVQPAVYTLYAHLASIAGGVRPGVRVARGQVLGRMGHTAGGYTIPRDRAHLHFEIGLAVTERFQAWYDRQRFGSRNEHGMWNGMNLMGIDPLDFMNAWRARRVNTFEEYFARMETVVRLRIATTRTPDFVERYPSLLTKMGPVAGWEIRFNWSGIPFSWTPLTAAEIGGLAPNRPKLVEVNAALERRQRSRTLATRRRGEWTVGKDLETVLEQLFALKM